MALVPFNVNGAAASQELEERLMQVGPYSLLLRQRPAASGNTKHLRSHHQAQDHVGAGSAPESATDAAAGACQQPDLSGVGFVLWQSGFVLSDALLLRLQSVAGAAGCQATGVSAGNNWSGVRVLELGCGGGTVGMFLALAGAQVVLTDQAHILPLTLENLELNFPSTRSAGSTAEPTSPAATVDPAPQTAAEAARKTFGKDRCPAANQQQSQQAQGVSEQGSSVMPVSSESAAAAITAEAGSRQVLSVADAFAAAFGTEPSRLDSHGCQHHQVDAAQQQLVAALAFQAGPLVVQYTWGEPLQELQQRVAAAAEARLAVAVPAIAPADGAAGLTQQLASSSSYDVIVGADLLYSASSHAALLDSLHQLTACSPHTQVFLCWRDRALGEAGFEEAAAAAGWLLEAAPMSLLHPEFQTGEYRLIRMVRLP